MLTQADTLLLEILLCAFGVVALCAVYWRLLDALRSLLEDERGKSDE